LLPLILRFFDALATRSAATAFLRLWLRIFPRDMRALLELASRSNAANDIRTILSAAESILAVGPASRDAMENLATGFMRRGDTETAMTLYARLDAQQGEPEVSLYETAYMDPQRVARGEPYVATLSDVLLETGQYVIFDSGKLYWLETSTLNVASNLCIRGRASSDMKYFAVSHPEPSAHIDEPVILLGTDGYNYSHWLGRNVLKLALLEIAGVPASLPILINDDLCGFQLEFLELLGIPRNRLMPIRRGTILRCRELLVPTTLRCHPKMSIGIDWLRKRVAHLIEPPDQARDLLFISRRDTGHRVLLNEAEIESALNPLGFRTVVPGTMSVAEQIRTFSRARVIVAAHGAALANLMFAPPHAIVVEITNTKIVHMGDFRMIAEQMRQRYFEVLSDWYPDHQPPSAINAMQRHDFFVKLDSVMTAVHQALDEVRAGGAPAAKGAGAAQSSR
jgi:capsular polysaccharide biosynthesis protein